MVAAMAADESAVEFIPGDLASGDGKALELDRRGLTISAVRSASDPQFAMGFEALWNEFGSQGEMESQEVIARRLRWAPATSIGGRWLRYEMILVRREDEFVAVRDHTAVVTNEISPTGPRAVVHLSHVLIHPPWRRTGLAGWLRAWPVQTARVCLALAGCPVTSPITLVAEMEHPDPQFPYRLIRLAAYEKAGFKKVAPDLVHYFQPDFRSPARIDAAGGPQPLPFGLVIRRVGREEEDFISGEELKELVQSLYHMYATGFRAQDMTSLWQKLEEYPPGSAQVPLVPATR